MNIVGKIDCLVCGHECDAKVSPKNHHITVTCSWQKGGCGCQFFSRTADCDEILSQKIKKQVKTTEAEAQSSEDATVMPEPKVSHGMFGGIL